MTSAFLILTIVKVFVMLAEHAVLTRRYKRESSLQRLTLGLSDSGKVDLAFVLVKWVPLGLYQLVIRLLTPLGLAYWLVYRLANSTGFEGIVPHADLHPAFSILLFFIAFDFAYYVSHRLMHRIPVLWSMHKLHHTAREMNIITGTRVSLIEGSFIQLINLLLLFGLFGMPRLTDIVAVLGLRAIVELLQHSDLPWDFGRLGKLVVSPRFHRMHHSRDPSDFDSNFSNLFPAWDYLFGTVSPRFRAEGPAVASEVPLGLDDAGEERRLNRWWYALWHLTFFDFAMRLVRKVKAVIVKNRRQRRATS